jgi:hypothetical protein
VENRLERLIEDARKIKTLTERFNSFREAKADEFLKTLFHSDPILSYLIKEENTSGGSTCVKFSYSFYVVTKNQLYIIHHIEQESDGNNVNLECQNHFSRYNLSDIKGVSCKHKPRVNDVKHEIKVSFFPDRLDFTFHVSELEGFKTCYGHSNEFLNLLNFISDLNSAIGNAGCSGAAQVQKQEQLQEEYSVDYDGYLD